MKDLSTKEIRVLTEQARAILRSVKEAGRDLSDDEERRIDTLILEAEAGIDAKFAQRRGRGE